MAAGDVFEVPDVSDVYYVDTGMFDTEYGAVYIVDAERPAVVDTGIGTHVDRIEAALEEVCIDPEALEVIAPSHIHLDHAGGAGFLAELAPEAEVYVHEIGAPHLIDPGRLVEGTKRAVGDQWQFYVEPKPVPEERVVALEDGDVVDLGDRELVANHVPGHAPHQVAFHEPTDGWVHAGDAAGLWVPSRGIVMESTPPPDFDFEQGLEDIETIRELDAETLLYPHFGPVTDVEAVLSEYRETLTAWVDAVAEKYQAVGEEATVEHFVETKGMEDVWGEVKARGEAAMNVRGVVGYLETSDYLEGRDH